MLRKSRTGCSIPIGEFMSLVFGPVPSRRLGRSLGINNIPPKSCSYSCRYCQVGPTAKTSVERRAFYEPAAIAREVSARLEELSRQGERVDYLTFVPSGEPTLDVGLGEAIAALKPLERKIAVITNGSLLWRADVRDELASADLVSVKIDAASERLWRNVNQPSPALRWNDVREGVAAFAERYEGTLLTETMLLAGVNDGDRALAQTAAFIARLAPDIAYLAVPTRPPAEADVAAPSEAVITKAYHLLAATLPRVECLLGYDEEPFAAADDVREHLLSISSVHPMRRKEVEQVLRDAGEPWSVAQGLVDEGALRIATHEGHDFFIRCPRRR
jgi:wyosine [tRNA(Phe)-imidazoG37] synthetase (radical SAM superfamily)